MPTKTQSRRQKDMKICTELRVVKSIFYAFSSKSKWHILNKLRKTIRSQQQAVSISNPENV